MFYIWPIIIVLLIHLIQMPDDLLYSRNYTVNYYFIPKTSLHRHTKGEHWYTEIISYVNILVCLYYIWMYNVYILRSIFVFWMCVCVSMIYINKYISIILLYLKYLLAINQFWFGVHWTSDGICNMHCHYY